MHRSWISRRKRNGIADNLAQAVHVRAYTVGPQIAFGAGEFALTNHAGDRLLLHEVADVLQQRHESSQDLSIIGVWSHGRSLEN